MDDRITHEQLKQALSPDLDSLIDDVVEAVNNAQPGSIIDDSEEPVRDATGRFRQVLFEKALELRGQSGAFSPSGRPPGQSVRWRNKGTQAIHITTINGRVEIRRRVWWANPYGCCAPLDSWLGLSCRYSQGVREMACRIGLDSSYRKSAADLLRLSQISMSYQSLRKIFQAEGQKLVIARRTGALAATFDADQCCAGADASTCLITGADGFQVPLITDEEKRKRRAGARRRRAELRRKGHTLARLPKRSRGSDQRWKEAKLVTFYDPRGRYQHTAATTGNHNVLGRIMRREAAKLRLDKADRKYSVSDGAHGFITSTAGSCRCSMR